MRLDQNYLVKALILACCLLSTAPGLDQPLAQSLAQSAGAPAGGPAQATAMGARGVGALRIRAWPRVGGEVKKLERKRFFLIKGSLAENRGLIEKIAQTPLLARDCYYRGIGASDALIKWLKNAGCESVYCREIALEDLEGSGAVPEFQAAYARGQKEFGSREVALKWITVNLREEIRSGFYRRQEETLRALVRAAADASKAKVQSVMTDRKGSAYFTDIEPGVYVVSNLLPTEIGGESILWNCEVEIKAKELSVAMKRSFNLSNAKDAPQKCFVEAPIPPCAQAGK